MTQGNVAAHLRDRLGADVFAPDDLASQIRRTAHTGAYAAVLAPIDADGVAASLALCSAEGWPVVAAGGATWLAGETDRSVRPVVISTVRLNAVLEHEPADLVIGIEAGVTLPRLSQQLAMHGQWLPLDPPAAREATIGAVAALGSAGPLCAGYGTPRDMVLGLQVATGDGRLLRFGGRVVKNVAGYDGVRLLVGSRGTLGVITSLYLRIRGAPRSDRTMAVSCGAGADGARRGAIMAMAVRDTFACDALELLSPAVAAHVLGGNADGGNAGVRTGRAGDTGWTVLVRLLGGEAAVQEGADRVRASGGPGRSGPGQSGADRSGWFDVPSDAWQRLSDLEADAVESTTLTGPVTSLEEGVAAVESLTPFCAAHAASGVIRLWRSDGGYDRSSDSGSDRGDVPLRAMASEHVTANWTSSYESVSAPVAALADRIRSVFDPAGILRPISDDMTAMVQSI